MKYTLFAIAGSLIISLSAAASLKGQDTTRATKITSMRYVQLSVSPGYFRSDNSAFNKDLQKEGFNPLSPDMINAIISLEFFFNKRFVLAGRTQFYSVRRSQAQPNNYESYLKGYAYAMSIGYILLKNEHLRFYIYGGLQSGRATFRIRDPDFHPHSKTNTVGSALSNPPRDLKYPLESSFNFDGGMCFERMVNLSRNKFDCLQNIRYLSIGAKLGYNAKMSVSSNPLSGLYANLSFGVGTRMKRVRWI